MTNDFFFDIGDSPHDRRAKPSEPVTGGKTYADIPVVAAEDSDEEFAEIPRECRAIDRWCEPPEC